MAIEAPSLKAGFCERDSSSNKAGMVNPLPLIQISLARETESNTVNLCPARAGWVISRKVCCVS